VWFKSAPFRAKVVSHPRSVLEEFGLVLPDSVKVHVWDTSAEQRYLVVPQRPAGTEGMTEEALAGLVTRDSMIGVGLALAPAPAGGAA
jgi:nitrile hydratase subunit alpha